MSASALAESVKPELDLSEEAQAAVNAGVVLTIDGRFAVRDSYWLFSVERATQQHRFRIMRHTLSNRYVVKVNDSDTPHMFRSIAQATDYIAAQASILLESYSNLQTPYSMRLSLDKFELPAPMRLNAFISDAWDLDTGWIVWQSAN